MLSLQPQAIGVTKQVIHRPTSEPEVWASYRSNITANWFTRSISPPVSTNIRRRLASGSMPRSRPASANLALAWLSRTSSRLGDGRGGTPPAGDSSGRQSPSGPHGNVSAGPIGTGLQPICQPLGIGLQGRGIIGGGGNSLQIGADASGPDLVAEAPGIDSVDKGMVEDADVDTGHGFQMEGRSPRSRLGRASNLSGRRNRPSPTVPLLADHRPAALHFQPQPWARRTETNRSIT